jgi:hypothetical protein
MKSIGLIPFLLIICLIGCSEDKNKDPEYFNSIQPGIYEAYFTIDGGIPYRVIFQFKSNNTYHMEEFLYSSTNSKWLGFTVIDGDYYSDAGTVEFTNIWKALVIDGEVGNSFRVDNTAYLVKEITESSYKMKFTSEWSEFKEMEL